MSTPHRGVVARWTPGEMCVTMSGFIQRLLFVALLAAWCVGRAAERGGKAVEADGDVPVPEFGAAAAGTVVDRTTAGKAGIPYHVYFPTSYTGKNDLPLLVAFSPSGDGMGMLNALKGSAEKVQWILVGCDRLSNDTESTREDLAMEKEVMDEVLAKVPHDVQRLYLAGFSGGAMRAYSMSFRRTERIAGIIAYGGWLGGAETADKKFCKYMSVAMVNGRRDKNANDWAEKDAEVLKKRHCHTKQFPFDGGHEVAPAEVTDQALAWLEDEWKEFGSKKGVGGGSGGSRAPSTRSKPRNDR